MAPQILLVAEPLFRRYNKTRFMYDVLSSLNADFDFLEIEPRTALPFLNKLDQLLQYMVLGARREPRRARAILWISEFKFSMANLIAARLIAHLHNMILVGGPHTLRADSDLLTAPHFQRRHLSRAQLFRIALYNLRDRFLIRRLDVLQSYSEEYAERIRILANQPNKPTIIFPIGSALPVDIQRWRPRTRAGDIRVVFWGIASALHGLSLLPPAFAQLRAKGLTAYARIISPENWFTRHLCEQATLNGVSSQFEYDFVTKISDDPGSAGWADIAISHLVAENICPQARELAETLLTNKMYEALQMGIPLLVARTPATTRLLHEDCAIFTEPGNAGSVADAIWQAAAQQDRLRFTGQCGRKHFEEHLACDVTARRIGTILHQADFPGG